MPEIIDISVPISSQMPVYPGTAQTKVASVKSGSGTAIVSEISLTSHTGTHIDAPNHVQGCGDTAIDDFALSRFYGPCRVLDMTGCTPGQGIGIEAVQSQNVQAGERLLFKTGNSARGYDQFYEDYVYLTSEAAQYLADCGVSLIGIDALSIKQRGAKDNTAHTALLAEGIPIIEGLDLHAAQPGTYTLIALPLAFTGIDGSPTRAVLVKT